MSPEPRRRRGKRPQFHIKGTRARGQPPRHPTITRLLRDEAQDAQDEQRRLRRDFYFRMLTGGNPIVPSPLLREIALGVLADEEIAAAEVHFASDT